MECEEARTIQVVRAFFLQLYGYKVRKTTSVCAFPDLSVLLSIIRMNNRTLQVAVWLLFTSQILCGAAVATRKAPASTLVVVNLVAAGAVVAYWGWQWYGYLFRGITWYATDQLLPAYALSVVVLSLFTLFGRVEAVGVHRFIFGVHTLVLLLAALFFTFFRMTRLS